MRKEAENYAPGDPTRAEIFREIADHASEFHRGDAVAGTVAWDDVSKAPSAESWTADERQTLMLAAQAMGASPSAAMQFQAAWDEHQRTDWSAVPMPDYRLIWDAAFPDKLAAFERAVDAIPDSLWDRLVAGGLAKNPRLVNMLVEHGTLSGR